MHEDRKLSTLFVASSFVHDETRLMTSLETGLMICNRN